MSQRTRLILLALSLITLVGVGWAVTGGFDFLLTQFWFTSGIVLLVLLSLVDQPHFSKDANIFANGVTAWVSLLLVPDELRSWLWWTFFLWAGYLIVSSYVLMLMRRTELADEPTIVRTTSRINREIGRPEAIFSAFFLWGVALQFGAETPAAGALFLFWAIFMIVNLPALARTVDKAFGPREQGIQPNGLLRRIVSPRIADITLLLDSGSSVVGRSLEIIASDGGRAATAVAIDDRIVAGARIGRVAITEMLSDWRKIGEAGGRVSVRLLDASDRGDPISFVDAGSEIGKLVFRVHPETRLQSGEVVSTPREGGGHAFYQVISASVREESAPEQNAVHTVKVTAGELGEWNGESCRFEPITWVAPAGQLIYRASGPPSGSPPIPAENAIVGWVPNSSFPVHVVLDEVVTHNTALIGVTGSGKSFLAFHLIEEVAKAGIKVLILDVSRQHDIYLTSLNPTPLKVVGDVEPWLSSETMVGIHQFGAELGGLPKATADFTAAAFAEMSKATLERGKNLPARLSIVFEEAHSLIPEWNQVAQEGDKLHVNRTARVLLQGRKYGMGALVVTQRTANVTKTILNQCNTIFALQSFDQTGLDFLRNYMGEEYSHAISTLPTRHAILVGMASSSTRPLLMRVVDMSGRWDDISEEPAVEVGGDEEEPADQRGEA